MLRVIEQLHLLQSMLPSNPELMSAYLDAAAARWLEQYVLWFHITVNDVMVVQQQQTPQHRVSKLAHETETEAAEFVLLDQLVEVHRQQLKRDADVLAECEVFQHVHHVCRVVRIHLQWQRSRSFYCSFPFPFLLPFSALTSHVFPFFYHLS